MQGGIFSVPNGTYEKWKKKTLLDKICSEMAPKWKKSSWSPDFDRSLCLTGKQNLSPISFIFKLDNSEFV